MTSTPGARADRRPDSCRLRAGGHLEIGSSRKLRLICEIMRPIWGGDAGMYDSRRAVPFRHHERRGGQEVAPQMQGRATMAWIIVAPTSRSWCAQRERRHAEVFS